MSNTLRKFKGEEYPEKKSMPWKQKKQFGHTDGEHSNHRDGIIPIKGEHFIKYGYPSVRGYPKDMVIAKKKGYFE